MIPVYRYTEQARQQCQCKTASEPWLHCLIANVRGSNYLVIFIWDTREVISISRTSLSDLNAPLANDNHKPLTGTMKAKDIEAINVAAGFIKPTEQIERMKQYLRSSRLGCLKGMVRIFERQASDERDGRLKHFDGIGFSRIDARQMTNWSKMLLRFELPSEHDIWTICNKMPKYAKQLVTISLQGQRSINADNVEKFLRSKGYS